MLSIVSLLIVGLAAARPLEKRAPSYQNLVVFGDQLSDTASPRGAWTLSNETVPIYGNYSSGNASSLGRFTNGATYIEQLASNLNLTLVSYAYGGATANSDVQQGYAGNSTIAVPGVYQQVQRYLNATPAANVSRSAFVILAGQNDRLLNSSVSAQSVVKQIVNATSLLVKANASAIAIGAPYSYGEAPYTASTACANCSLSTVIDYDIWSADFLGNATSAVSTLNNQTGIVLRASVFDLYSLVQEIYSDPTTFGFNDTAVFVPCYQGGIACTNQSTYPFWDLYNPTTTLHTLFGQVAAAAVFNITGLASTL